MDGDCRIECQKTGDIIAFSGIMHERQKVVADTTTYDELEMEIHKAIAYLKKNS